MLKQKLIKLRLIGLNYNREEYNLMKLTNWLNEKNDIIFITIPELINSDIFTQFNHRFLIPALTSYEDYLKVERYYGGLPIALEKYDTEYLEWLKFIKFYNFINQYNIKFKLLFRSHWCISSHNYKSIKKINSELEKKPIKIKKLKI